MTTIDETTLEETSGTSDLAPFVPVLAVELGRRPSPSWTSVDGSMLSADISGFTALSEKLAGKGKAGAEEITELINICFTGLIDAAYDYGGEVIKFGGDALLILVRGERHERRAADAGLSMQRVLHSSPAAKRAHLTMTVGVADGPFDVFLAGSGYRELLISGRRATEVIRLEGEAEKGDTLVSPGIAEQLPAAMRVGGYADGVLIDGSTGDPPTGPRARDAVRTELSAYVPRPVLDQLSAFAGLGGEHRLVTVGFVMVTGVSPLIAERGTEGAAAAFGTIVDEVVEACEQFGVTALHTDIAPDGVKFVLCAGAPVNPGDTADALLQAALRISRSDSPFVIRQGVQTGRVFAGFLGSENRRTYTLMGDPVNTAARMIGKAGDREIVAVESVVGDTRTVFETEPLEPFHVKGKTEPITAHRVVSMTDRTRRDSAATRLVGRRRELDVLTRAAGALDVVVEVVGPAGVGKSRLLDAAWDAAEGLAIHQAACTPYGAASPYSLFRPLLRTGFGIDVDAGAGEAGDELRARVEAAAPELLPMLPLLALPFGAAVDPTPEVDALRPEFRREQIHRTLLAFLDATITEPLLLVAEDAHWIDEASGDLLNHLVRASAGRPWAAIITRRDEGGWRVDDTVDHVVTVRLEPLTADDVASLALQVSARPLTDLELGVIAERSGGNPLFVLELVRAMERSGELTMPDSVEQLVVERFDQLPPEVRRVIRVAAVLGNRFAEDEVHRIVEAETGRPCPPEALAEAERQAIVSHLGERRWTFVHALYRDAAYEALPYRRRRILHGLAAEIIESMASDPVTVAPLLSLHYDVARDHARALEFSLIAADQAERQHATADAAAAYERALRASRYQRPVDRPARAEIASRLGDRYFVMGRFEDAERTFALARRLTDDDIRDVELMRRIGEVKERQSRPDAGARWYRRAAKRIPPGGSKRVRSARAQVALAEGALRHRLGDDAGCVELARRALTDAEAAGDERSVAIALERIHVASVHLRDHDSDAGHRALAAHRSLGDQSGVIRTLINLGAEEYFTGRWTEGRAHYLEAAELAYLAGDVVLGAMASMNAAEIVCDQGRWPSATGMFDDARRNFAAVGYPIGVAAATLYASVATIRSGRLEDAAEQIEDARRRIEEIGAGELLDDLETRLIELRLAREEPTVAEAIELADRLGPGHSLVPRVSWLRVVATCQDGDLAGARAALAEAVELSQHSEFDRLVTFALLAALDDDPTARRECERLKDLLGVVALPPVVEAVRARR